LIALADVAAVERRVAQLADGERPPIDRTSGGAAFSALLAAGGAAPGGAPPPPPPPRSIPFAELERTIAQASAANGVDPALVKAVIANESGFDAGATSSAGAQGLMQLMPGTAASEGVADAYDPRQNVAGGTHYLRGLLERFHGNVALALAGYNAGPGAVERGAIGTETRDYVRSVLASYAALRASAKPDADAVSPDAVAATPIG
jgi:soluble lytic murein transglycosylase-like protein